MHRIKSLMNKTAKNHVLPPKASDEKLSSFRRRFIRLANYVCNKPSQARFK